MRLTDLLAPDKEYSLADLPLGEQEPTHRLVPPAQYSHGHDAIDFAEYCGYDLYEFQKNGLIDDLGCNMVEQRDGSLVERWAAGETEEICSRRNGKSVRLEVIILFALFILREPLIMYTAHRDDTAEKIFKSIVAVLKRTPKLWAEVIPAGPRYTNGQRAIELKTGEIVYFRTRTTDSARGQGFKRLILDEDQNLTDEQMAALMPLVSGEENAQINYAGSAGGLAATVQASLWRDYELQRRSLCYRGWHADADNEFDDLGLVARINPRLGRGLTYEFVAKEFARMTRPDFGRERCGVQTYPRRDGMSWVIPKEAWDRAEDVDSQPAPDTPLHLVLEADPELERGTISVAGRRVDEAMHLEVVQHDPGVVWMIERTKELRDRWGATVWLDPKGPLGFMTGDLDDAEIKYKTFEAGDLVASASWIYTAANPPPNPDDPGERPPPTVRHRGAPVLTNALAAAQTRKLLDRWTWRRAVATGANQGPVVGCSLAGWAVIKSERAQTGPPPLPRKAGGDRAATRQPPRRHPPRRGNFNPQNVDF